MPVKGFESWLREQVLRNEPCRHCEQRRHLLRGEQDEKRASIRVRRVSPDA
jgi:hypothetical protein